MNRIIISQEQKIEGDNFYQSSESLLLNHLHQVLGSKEGDELKGILLNHSLGKLKVLKLDELQVVFQYIEENSESDSTQIDLMIGVSRPPTCKKLLEHATTMGAKSFHFFKAELSEKSYLDSKIFQEKKYKEFLHLGLAQAAIYSKEPIVEISSQFPSLSAFSRHQKFVLSLDSKKTFHDYRPNFKLPILLAIGPERGWTSAEQECLQQMEFLPVSIGPSTLRVEHATYSALAQLAMLKEQNNA